MNTTTHTHDHSPSPNPRSKARSSFRGESRPAERREAGPPTVIIFSKDRDTRLLYRTMVEMWGYEAKELSEMSELLESSATDSPCVLLFDTILPFADNLTTVHRLRQSIGHAEMPIVVVSGFSQPQYRSVVLTLGADEFLVKPVDFDTLEVVLRKSAQLMVSGAGSGGG